AYIIGNTRQPLTQAFSDDGEPSGTAGKPMLHVLTERGLGNTLAVVVRYFGGVKLGAGGLVRAYSAAVSQATALASFTTISPQRELSLSLAFADEARLRQLLQQCGGEVLTQHYSQQVELSVRLPEPAVTDFIEQMNNVTAGQAQILSPLGTN
ncbi:MAG: IMPACT family protein, partial [Alishewanella sp.]|nr:IMPACT family protein [Alishewanella sp.]